MNLTHRFCFVANGWHTPMAPWMRRPISEPLPRSGPVAAGPAALEVRIGRHDLVFGSLAELDHFLDVLSRTPLPRPSRLIAAADAAGGPNGHWLSRLPTALKGPKRHRWLPHLSRLREQVAGLDWATEAMRSRLDPGCR